MEKQSRRSVMALLPDDVVMDILRRMSILDVFKCRRVCRRWRDLVSTQHFQQMHLKANANRSSMVLFQMFNSIKDTGALLVLDKWEKSRKTPTIRRSRPNFIDDSGSGFIDVKLSCDGLIVIKSTVPVNGLYVFTILNPISGDAVRIETPNPAFFVYAMFFNRLIQEYCILFLNCLPVTEFEMVNLGAQPSCRTLPVSFPYKSCELPGIVVDDDATVYWRCCDPPSCCEELIMSFDIKTERFSFMPHPHPIHNCQDLKHKGMHILKINGHLSFVQSTTANEINVHIINIWTLKDSATRLWTKTYSVNIAISSDIHPFWLSDSYLMVMAVENGELLLQYSSVRVCVYNLALGTLRRVGKSYLESYLDTHGRNFYLFMPSCVSLRNCKPVIRMSHFNYLQARK